MALAVELANIEEPVGTLERVNAVYEFFWGFNESRLAHYFPNLYHAPWHPYAMARPSSMSSFCVKRAQATKAVVTDASGHRGACLREHRARAAIA